MQSKLHLKQIKGLRKQEYMNKIQMHYQQNLKCKQIAEEMTFFYVYYQNYNQRVLMNFQINTQFIISTFSLFSVFLTHPLIIFNNIIFIIFLKIKMSYMFPVYIMLPIETFIPYTQIDIKQTLNQNYKSSKQQTPEIFTQKPEKYFQIFRAYLQKRSTKLQKKNWKKQEDDLLMRLGSKGMSWQEISQAIPETNQKICKRRFQRIKETLIRWPQELDNAIKNNVQLYGHTWSKIHDLIYSNTPQKFPRHSVKQIKQRYLLNLRPGIVNQQWSIQQDLALLRVVKGKGTHWRKLSLDFCGRTQLQLKNRYYGTLKSLEKKVMRKLNMKMKQLKKQKK